VLDGVRRRRHGGDGATIKRRRIPFLGCIVSRVFDSIPFNYYNNNSKQPTPFKKKILVQNKKL
jgi:hypothetical protein